MTPRPFEVLLTEGAERDLAAIVEYIAQSNGPSHAAHVLEQLLVLTHSLTEHPERGSRPKELLTLGISEYQQLLFKPYRLIYRIAGNRVYIHLVADGRREMQTLLARRLLEG
ncbi:MAG: plasmid stabilization protein [Alphaproteobacteria bacterium CG_4_10_14_0_2_um_filter_63_37]|nr:MAG: plasmid stabilization protein [Proteobacteria bacterium CG1_02_64_396]PJA25404.1 MAG: plasmid stabilization protein [Alphaproteobacteria bacterium CG_4_10_14_0_2_um_filter_63_37]